MPRDRILHPPSAEASRNAGTGSRAWMDVPGSPGAELSRSGWTRSAIESAVTGRVRVRRGQPTAHRTTNPGGARCTSVAVDLRLRALRRWRVGHDGPQVRARSPDAARLRPTTSGTSLHWPATDVLSAEAERSRVSWPDAVIDALGCLDRRSALASIDSSLRIRRRRGGRQWRLVLRHVSAADRRLSTLVDRRAESGLESIVRLLVMDLGFAGAIQVPFAGSGVWTFSSRTG